MIDLNALPLPDLYRTLAAGCSLRRLLELARDEDLGPGGGAAAPGDISSLVFIEEGRRGSAAVVARQAGVVAGLAVLPEVLATFGGGCAFEAGAADGGRCAAGEALGRVSGPLRAILALERTLLNLVGRACGVATLTRGYVEAVAGTGAVICDTRKTMPGLRALDKYSVRCGGGHLHRVGLYDAVLLKDNHLAHVPLPDLARRVAQAAAEARRARDLRFVEVEVDSLEQLGVLLALPEGVLDIVLLDNMTPGELRRAVMLRDAARPGLALEASGGITRQSVRAVAETGVERISIGALTHSAPALEVGLDMQP